MHEKISGLTKQESEAISKLKLELQGQFGKSTEIILFGSKARGDANEFSDIDILILVDGEIDNTLSRKIRHIGYDIERNVLDYKTFFQLIVRPKKWWEDWKDALPFAQNVAKEGIWL